MNSYPRETVEFQPVTVTVDGEVITSNVMLAVTGTAERPTNWIEPDTLGDKIGIMVKDKKPGYYQVWAKVTSSPELPVIDCGIFQVT